MHEIMMSLYLVNQSYLYFLPLIRCFFSLVAWIGSLAIGITYMAGPISTSLCYRWGCRVVMCLGSAIFLASMLITSFAPQLSVMYLTYGVLFGFGASCCYFSSFYVLIIYFNKYLALANGIAAAGVGAGTMAISLMIDKLIASYGLRIAFQGMAGLSVLLFLAGLTFIPMDSKEEEKLCEKVSLVKKREENKTLGRLVSSFRKVLKPNPVWRNKAFAAWTIAAGMVFFANYIPYVYLVSVSRISCHIMPVKVACSMQLISSILYFNTVVLTR